MTPIQQKAQDLAHAILSLWRPFFYRTEEKEFEQCKAEIAEALLSFSREEVEAQPACPFGHLDEIYELKSHLERVEGELAERIRLSQIAFDSGKQTGELKSFEYFNGKEIKMAEELSSLKSKLEKAVAGLREILRHTEEYGQHKVLLSNEMAIHTVATETLLKIKGNK